MPDISNTTVTRWQRVLHTIYEYAYRNRSFWVDVPWVLLTAMTWREFYSHGAHPVPPSMPWACYGLLGLYVSIKTTVKRRFREYYHRRWGGLFAMAWVTMLCVMWIMKHEYPGNGYEITSQAIWTMFVVLGTYLGVRYIPIPDWLALIASFIKRIGEPEEDDNPAK